MAETATAADETHKRPPPTLGRLPLAFPPMSIQPNALTGLSLAPKACDVVADERADIRPTLALGKKGQDAFRVRPGADDGFDRLLGFARLAVPGA